VLATTLLIALLWSSTNPSYKVNLSSPAVAADAHARIQATIHHPLHLGVVMFNTFIGQSSDAMYQMFAGDFGWLDTPVPLWVTALVVGMVVYSLLTEYEISRIKSTKYYNLSIVAIALLLYATTCAVFYVYLTPIGSRQIMGLQGRYFIPIIILLGFMQGNKIFRTSEQEYKKLVLLVAPVILTASIVTIIGRFYL
jgi:uncharacterized membrane protein